MKVKAYTCQNCGYEFRYNRKIIACGVCAAKGSIVEKDVKITKEKVIKTLEDAKFHFESNDNIYMQLRLEDALNYLKGK